MAGIFTGLISAIISGIVALLVWRTQRKVERIEAEAEARHKSQVNMHVYERELQVAMAETIKLTAKKVNDSGSVNGELEQSTIILAQCQKALQDYTNKMALQNVEK